MGLVQKWPFIQQNVFLCSDVNLCPFFGCEYQCHVAPFGGACYCPPGYVADQNNTRKCVGKWQVGVPGLSSQCSPHWWVLWSLTKRSLCLWIGVMVCITKSNSPHRTPGHYEVLTLRSFWEVHKAKEWSCDELTCYTMPVYYLMMEIDFLCFLFKYLDTELEQPTGC